MIQAKPTFYWDACTFYEHFKTSEPVSPTKRQAIRRILLENHKEQNTIVTSSITHLEVLPEKYEQRR